jgi:hypothetical protein
MLKLQLLKVVRSSEKVAVDGVGLPLDLLIEILLLSKLA